MKISTLVMAALAAVTALSGVVVAQHGGDMTDHFSMLAKHLGLSPSQESAFKTEHAAAKKRIDAINADTKLDAKAKGEAMAKVHADVMAKAKKILDPAQQKKLEGMMHGLAAQHEMMSMLDKLGLSEAQKTSLHKVFGDAMDKMGKIHDNTKLTDAQRQAQANQLHQEVMEKIHGLLTPEQMERAKALHQGGGHSIPPK